MRSQKRREIDFETLSFGDKIDVRNKLNKNAFFNFKHTTESFFIYI